MNEASTLIEHPFVCSGHRRPMSPCSICRARRMVSDRVILSPHRSPGHLVCKTCCRVATQLGPNSATLQAPDYSAKMSGQMAFYAKSFWPTRQVGSMMSPCRLHKVLEGSPLPNSSNHIGFKLQLL